MMKWSLASEFLAFIMISMIMMNLRNHKFVQSPRKKILRAGLGLSLASILFNAVCVYTIDHYHQVPHWLNMALNSGYFLLSVWMCSMLAIYLFDLLLEHVYDKTCRTRAYMGIAVLSAGYTLLTLSNIWNQRLFWFDESGVYHKGPLNLLGYVVMPIELGMLVACYLKNRASIGKNVSHVMKTLPPTVLLLAAFQLAYPQLLLNGTIAAFTELILFINFQNFQVEQDGLTRLGNRRSCYEELSLRLAGEQRFQVISVSLENFAVINQRFGHQKGDEFLYAIACWMDNFGEQSRAFRFANVTFVLVCPYLSEEKAEQNLNRIRERFSKPWILGEMKCGIPARFGNMIHQDQKWEATQAVEFLVYMIAEAKKKDLATICFRGEIEKVVERRKRLTALLKDSIEKKRFQIWYQPIYDFQAGSFLSAEALLRVRDYDGTMISPAEFIPLAEEEGLIDSLSWIVLEEVCRFLGSHRGLPLETVSINLSMQQFMNAALYQKIKHYLGLYHIPPKRLKLEITERVILYDQKYMKRMMEEMTRRGIGFYLDDFGTGYANFSSVMHLPFECIKLDRSLFSELPANQNDRLIVRTVIELFHNLGMKVISEGIETEEQLAMIQELGSDFVQGYVFAKPMCEQDLLEFYRAGAGAHP